MAAEERWYFTKEQLQTTPSRKGGIDPDKELSYRQQAANFIQDMGQRLQVNQLCINTAIVYVHRFYMFHSFTRFHRNAISTCALFLAAKVEEQPRKLEHVIKVAHMCLHREAPPLDSKSEAYLEQSHELISNENIMLQTLGFDVAIDHPHTHVVKCCQLVRGGGSSLHQHHASKDLAQTSYFMATNSLHLTTMCLQYKPTVVACVCIHLACKWADWEIPRSSEGKDWFWYVDKTVTVELLEELTAEFLAILDRCPSRLKRKMMSSSGTMNDKIQDTAMVEKKLAAEFAAQASSRANLAPPGTSATPLKPDRHHERSSNQLRQPTNSSSSSKTAVEHTESSAATPASSESMPLSIDKNGTPSTDRKERGPKRGNVSGNSTSSKAMLATLSSLIAAPSTPPAELTPPPAIVSPPTITKNISSQDLGYSSLSQDCSAMNTYTSPPAVSTPKKAKLQQWGSSNAVVGTGNSSGGGGSSGRGLTPKEYRELKEQKKRERAEKKERSQSNHPSSTPQSIKTDVVTPEKELIKLNLSSSSSDGSANSLTALSASRHMQPVVALTSLNISALNKVPSSKHGGLSSSRHTHLLKTPEKQKLHVDSDGGGSFKKDDDRVADEVFGSRIGQVGTNHCGQSQETAVSEDPVPALVRPPILTPSPPLATGEESKPDILDERPSSISFSSSMEEIVPEESHNPLSVKLQPAFLRSELYKKEREEARLHTTSSSSLHSTPSSGSSSHGKPSSRRHEIPATKERLIKHHKSKTPVTPPTASKVHQVATLLPTTPQTQSSIDNAISALLTSPQVPLPFIQPPLPLHSFGTDMASHVPDVTKMDTKTEPRTSFSSSHLLPNVGPVSVSQWPSSENGAEILTQERIHLGTTATSERNMALQNKESVPPIESKGNVVAKSLQPPLLSQPPMPPKLSRVEEAKHSFGMETPLVTRDKQPQVTVTTPAMVPVKHEKREKHKHKDRDRERSKDKRSAVPVPISKEPSPAPAIKLTIPKERFHVNTTEGMSGGNTIAIKGTAPGPPIKESVGGLKIKIPKGKISKSLKSSVSPVPIVVAPVAVSVPPTTLSISSDGPPKEGGGLKIKITKDRLSSKGSYNLSVSGRDESRDRSMDRNDSRKRERVPSPVATIHKQPLLPIPTGESAIGSNVFDTDSKPPKAAKLSSRTSRKSQSHANSPYDVPPSSNTRSSSSKNEPQPRSEPYGKPRTGRGHKTGGGSKHRGRGGGGGGMGGPHPHFGGHQVTLNAGPYPYTQFFPYPPQPNYFNHPMSHHPPPPHPHGPIPPPSVHHGHPGEYPPPPFFGQPPYRGPPPPIAGGSSFQSQANLMRRHLPPPLPSEPPPVIPPPPPE